MTMGAVTVEAGRRSLWVELRGLLRVWVQVEATSHWDAWWEGGELEVRAGRLAVILTGRAVILRERAGGWAVPTPVA
jgi:hypothetical protein